MTKRIAWAAGLACLAWAPSGFAQEVGRVISSTPLIQQVAVPQQICQNQQVLSQAPKSGAGAAMGAIAGGALGNAVGQGSGRAAATMLGLVGGAIMGDRVEGPGQTQVHNVQQCSTQTVYENRTMGYQVVYEYNGKQYSVQMPNDPGPTVRLQVSPVGSLPVDGAAPAMPPPAPQFMAAPPVITSSTSYQPLYMPPPVVMAPYPGYYPPSPFIAPIGLSIGLGYSRVYGHGHHWR